MSLCVLLVVSVGPVFAQGGGETTDFGDMIGIYLDPDGQKDCANGVPPGTSHFYVILQNLSSEGVSGLELKLKVTGDFTVSNIKFPHPHFLEEGDREGEIIVWFSRPIMAVEGQALVMEFDGHLETSRPVTLFTRPVRYPSISGQPCYLDAVNSRLVKPLTPASGSVLAGVCFLNAEDCGPMTARATLVKDKKALNP